MLALVAKLNRALDRLASALVVLMVGAMTAIVFAQVFSRYVIFHSLPWSEELARYLMIWASFLGAGVALRRGLHVGVTFLRDLLPPRSRAGAAVLGQLASLCLLYVVARYGLQVAAMNMSQLSPAMRIPMGYAYLAVPVGSVLMMTQVLETLLRSAAGLVRTGV